MAEYTVGDELFPSKKAAKQTYSEILYRHPPTERIEGRDEELLFQLLKVHPWRRSIAGKSEVEYFITVIDPVYRTYSLKAIRKDGTDAAFPIGRAFEKRNPTKRDIFRAKCRQAVAPQILAAKKIFFNVFSDPVCLITGEQLSWGYCHVDHIHPFECMIRDWEKQTNYDYSQDSINQFAAWHSMKAELRCISPKANLGRKDDTCD